MLNFGVKMLNFRSFQKFPCLPYKTAFEGGEISMEISRNLRVSFDRNLRLSFAQEVSFLQLSKKVKVLPYKKLKPGHQEVKMYYVLWYVNNVLQYVQYVLWYVVYFTLVRIVPYSGTFLSTLVGIPCTLLGGAKTVPFFKYLTLFRKNRGISYPIFDKLH